MTAAAANLFTRPDTLLGVCEGLGQETGVPPIVFRLGFAFPLIFAPLAVIGVYVALGVTLAAMRWLLPRTTGVEAVMEVAMAEPLAGNDDMPLRLAA